MSDTLQTFTLNDFPTELIDRFAPDRRPTTISALKLVSKRFNEIFSYDYYYKFYLHFAEKHYLCEAKSVKNSGKEVFKDIESGSVGKWKGYLTIENIHLKNWSKGEITHTEIVPLPKQSIAGFSYKVQRWQELIDENSEHWLLNVDNNRAIVLINITDKPKMLVYPEMNRGARERVVLLSGQVICLNISFGHITVLDIVYDGDVISLRYKFAFDINLRGIACWNTSFGKCESDGSYKSMFIYCRPNGVLQFTDLKTGNVLEDICLGDYKFRDSYNDGCNYFSILRHQVEFPFIVVMVGGIRTCNPLILFNVEKMQVTTFFYILDTFVSQCYISCNVAYILSSNDPEHCFQQIHRVSLERSCENMEKPATPELLSRGQCKSYLPTTPSKSLKSAYIDYNVYNKVHVMSIKDSGVSDLAVFIDIDEQFKILGVIGSDTLIVKTRGKSENIISYKIPKEEGGQCVKVVDWGRVIAENRTPHHAPPVSFRRIEMLDLVNYSKCVFFYEDLNDNQYLAFFHF